MFGTRLGPKWPSPNMRLGKRYWIYWNKNYLFSNIHIHIVEFKIGPIINDNIYSMQQKKCNFLTRWGYFRSVPV